MNKAILSNESSLRNVNTLRKQKHMNLYLFLCAIEVKTEFSSV